MEEDQGGRGGRRGGQRGRRGGQRGGQGRGQQITVTAETDLSKDGGFVYYSTNVGDIDRRHLWRTATYGGQPTQLTYGTGIETDPAPLASGREVAILSSTYLDAERDFGTIAPGLLADLVLLTDNPLDDIEHVRTRVGVMKRGRWFSADELETALTGLAEERE